MTSCSHVMGGRNPASRHVIFLSGENVTAESPKLLSLHLIPTRFCSTIKYTMWIAHRGGGQNLPSTIALLCVKELIVYAVFTVFGFFASLINCAVLTSEAADYYKLIGPIYKKTYFLCIAATVTLFHFLRHLWGEGAGVLFPGNRHTPGHFPVPTTYRPIL